MRTFAICLVTTSLFAMEPLPLMDTVTVGSTELKTKALPKGFALREDIGLITASAVKGQVVHRTQTRVLETRATITPKGDYLLMFPEGDHYAKSKGEKINSMMACRSSDHGKTWSAPVTISADGASGDLGYPSTVELADGTLLTLWYEKPASSPRAQLRLARWRLS